MNRILCSSPYIPKQWIAAHQMEPYLVRPSGDCAHPCVARVEGLCSYASAWISSALADTCAAGIVLAMTCDQMRRAFEVLCAHSHTPCFFFNIPATCQTAQAKQLYKDELQRLGRFLVRAGGRAPSAEVLAELMLKSDSEDAPESVIIRSGKVPLALIGPHETAEDQAWLDMIAQANAEITLDCSSSMHPVFNRNATLKDPFTEFANACFEAIQDVFQRPNSGFYLNLDKALQQNAVKGLIVQRYLWCDLWHAEIYRLKRSPVPVLDLELGNEPAHEKHRLAARIQAFMETLQ